MRGCCWFEFCFFFFFFKYDHILFAILCRNKLLWPAEGCPKSNVIIFIFIMLQGGFLCIEVTATEKQSMKA